MPGPPNPLTGPAYVVARSLLLCPGLALDEAVPALARKVQDHGRRHFAADMVGHSQTDVELWVRDLLRAEPDSETRHPVDRLYGRLWREAALEIRWEAAGPVVPTKAVRVWLGLLNDFDESFLVSFDRLRLWRPFAPLPDVPAGWGVVTRVGDIQLDALLDHQRVTDLHVHLSGIRQGGIAWARAMASPRGWADFAQLRELFSATFDASWEDEAIGAYSDRRWLGEKLGVRQLTLADVWRHPDPLQVLRDERRLLIAALAHSRQARAKSTARAADTARLETRLWRYLGVKHRYHHCTRQPAFAGAPGLSHFDSRYFRATKPGDKSRHAPRAQAGGARFRSGKGFARMEHKAAARVLAAEGCLAEVELRISPFGRAADYVAFLQGWREIMAQLQKSGEFGTLPKARFAVHLIRTQVQYRDRIASARRNNPGAIDSHLHWRTFHGEISRQTAILQRALADPRHLGLTSLISRIDVAGQERDTPIELFSPHLRLLRGDEAALLLLEDIRDGRWDSSLEPGSRDPDRPPDAHDYLVHATEWRRMAALNRHRDRPGGALLMTLHAGEDYADPLAGLFQIWAAVETAGLRPGEGIGHALALADPLEPWGSSFARLSWLEDWSSLLWLRSVLREIDSSLMWTPEGNLLAELIGKADRRLFGPRPLDRIETDFQRFYAPEDGIPAIPERLWGRAIRDEAGISAAARAPLAPLVLRARDRLRERLIEKGVVIEGNPSSNIRVSGTSSLAELPTVALFELVRDGLLFCVNTDNPGTFATSIRTEYAVLLQGARDRARDRGERAMDNLTIQLLLQKVLEIGQRLVGRR